MRHHRLWLEPEVHTARKHLPGHVRQQIGRAIEGLANQPRPPQSQALDVTELDIPPGVELRRLRIGRWRVIYAVNDGEQWVWILGIRRGPPYDYEDLAALIARIR